MQFGPGLSATFLYYFATTAVVFTLVASKSLGMESGVPQAIGAAGGILAGAIGAYFNRTVTFAVPLGRKKQGLIQLENCLTALGYELVSEEDGVRVYQRSGWSRWFSGQIFLQIEVETATIASRAVMIRYLRRQLESKS